MRYKVGNSITFKGLVSGCHRYMSGKDDFLNVHLGLEITRSIKVKDASKSNPGDYIRLFGTIVEINEYGCTYDIRLDSGQRINCIPEDLIFPDVTKDTKCTVTFNNCEIYGPNSVGNYDVYLSGCNVRVQVPIDKITMENR